MPTPEWCHLHYTQASALHKAGNLAEAEPLYRDCLALWPEHAESNHRLGALLVQRHGKAQYEEAKRLVQASIICIF